METVLTPPLPFTYDQSLLNITTGSLSDSWKKWSKGFTIYFDACELSKKNIGHTNKYIASYSG